MQLICTLVLLFTFAIGNVWAATSTNPATKSYGGKTFLDVAATAANARIKNSDSTLVYNSTYLLKTLNPAWITGTTATDKSDSKSNFSNLPDYGFLAEGSSSGVNTTNEGGYSYIKITNAKEFVIYVTGTNSIAFLGKGNKDNSNKWIGVKVEEIDSEGNATVVADASSNKNYSSSNAITEATTNTASEALVISPSKYYRATVTSGNSSNCQVWQFRFGKAPAANYTVTYALNGGTGTTPTESAKAAGAKFNLHDGTTGITAPSGKEFDKWKDQDANIYAAGAEFTMPAKNVTLTAQWRDPLPKYTVTYDLNGASGDAPTETSKAEGDAFNLAAAPSWAGHAFDGWLCSADAAVKAAGSSYTMTAANTTFTAQWHEVDCKIYSLTGGIGSAVVQQANATVNDGVSLILSNSDGIIKLSPASGSFNAGDIVTISGTVGNTTKEFGVKISNAADRKATLGTASVAGTTNPMVATATLSAASDHLYICRTGGTTQTILTCEVHRACAEGTAAGLSYAEAEVNKTEGDAAFTNPLTNANSLVLDGYKSSNEEVATVNFSTGEVTIVGAGSATITANSAIQTKAGTLYAAGTASYTLNVAALPEYTVTYDLNGGSGDPTEVDHKAGEKFNLHDGVTGITAPTSKTFVNWKDQDDALFAGGAEYTMPAKNVTLTAQWAGDVYTVKFMDGETLLDTKVVEVGSHPTDIEHPTKPLYTFAAWQLSGSDVNLDDVSGAKDAVVTLTARWAKVYASNADFEAYIIANKSEKDDADKAEAYVKSLNYALSTKTGTTFDANDETNNGAYAGLKIKNAGTVLSWNVVAGKVVELKAGVMVANGSLAINSGTPATIDGGSTTSGNDNYKIHYFYSATEALYEFTTSNGSAEVIKTITMRDPYTVSFEAHGDADPSALPGQPSVTLPDATNGTASLLGWFDAETGGNKIGDAGDSYTPTANITLHAQWEAVSTDARLASITFSSAAGTLEPAFDPEVTNYTYTMPYGTAAVPTITSATAVNANAKAPVIDAQAANWGDVAHIHGVAQSDDTKDYYITMKIAPKDGVSIIKVATTGGTNKTVTGLYAGDGDVNLSGSKKMDNGKYIGFTLDGTTLQAGDQINVHTTTAANTEGSHIIFYDNMTDKNELYETGEIGGTGDNIFEINAAMIGATTAYVYRSNADAAHQWNGYVDFIEVTRAMNPVLTAITIDGRDGEIDALDDKHFSVTIPYESDLAALTVVPTIVRNAAHPTTPEAVISNEGAWILGDNTYRIMDKDGDYTDYTITLDRDVLKHTVSFNTHGGSAIADVEVVHGGYLAAAPVEPTKDENVFKFWSEDEDGAEVDVTTVQINADKEFHAVWEAEPAGIKLINGDVVNHTNFLTGTNETTVEIESVEHKCVDFTTAGSNRTTVASIADLKEFIQYNATTNKAKIKLTLYNTKSSAVSAYLHMLEEGSETPTTEEISIPAGEVLKTDFYEFNSEKNRSFYITCGNRDYIKVLQVKVIDDGTTTLKKAGQVGYSVNTLKSRIFAPQQSAISFEGLTINANAVCKPLSNTALKIKNAYNISFHADAAMTLAVTTEGNQTYYVSTTADGTTNETSFTGRKEFEITAGDWYIHAGSSELKVAKLEFIAPKCEEPTITPMSNSDLCEGDDFAPLTVSASVSDEGTLHYAWYKEAGADDEAVGTDAASYTPEADGEYYVVVTNRLADHSDNSATSNTITVKHFAAAVITTAPLNQRGEVGDVVTLSVVATGKNVSYKWYTCDEDGGNEEALDPAETGTSLNVTVTAGMSQWYKVIVTSDCGNAEAKAKVSEFEPTTPASVTTSILWDWTSSVWPASGTAAFTNEDAPDYELLADADAIVPNAEGFRSDMLYGKGQYVWRSGNKFFQGTAIKFTTEVAGRVRVYFRSTGSGKTVEVAINGTSAGSRTNSFGWSSYVEVPAGEVEMICTGDGYTRVQKIEFEERVDQRGAGWAAAGELGTVCLESAAVVTGANLYELAGLDVNGYLAFDQILSGELEAGKPYLFEATSNALINFYAPVNAGTADQAEETNGMHGTFTNKTFTAFDESIYYFSGRHIWAVKDFTVSITIPAHYCYVDMSELQNSGASEAPAPGRRRISMSIMGSQIATGIENTGFESEAPRKVLINGELYILRGEKMYDAKGQLVK